MDGTLSVASEPGNTVFTLTLVSAETVFPRENGGVPEPASEGAAVQ
jgi:hypothetical protein